VTFLDTNQKITYSLPDVAMTGIFWGSQTLQLSNSLIFHDEENSLKAHISFDNSGGAAQKRFKNCTDKKASMYGLIYRYNKSKKGTAVDPSVPLHKASDIVTEHE